MSVLPCVGASVGSGVSLLFSHFSGCYRTEASHLSPRLCRDAVAGSIHCIALYFISILYCALYYIVLYFHFSLKCTTLPHIALHKVVK